MAPIFIECVAESGQSSLVQASSRTQGNDKRGGLFLAVGKETQKISMKILQKISVGNFIIAFTTMCTP